jgi:hypothetical protein
MIDHVLGDIEMKAGTLDPIALFEFARVRAGADASFLLVVSII